MNRVQVNKPAGDGTVNPESFVGESVEHTGPLDDLPEVNVQTFD